MTSTNETTTDAHAQGYAEAVAALRDDARYTNWWMSSDAKPDGRIRHHLADYLETVGPDGVDVETGRWPAREHAVIRAAIAWRAHSGDQPQVWADADDLALIEAVDALPHAGESQAGEPADAEQIILSGLINRRVEVEGPDFDHADAGLIGYARSVQAALVQAGLLPTTTPAERLAATEPTEDRVTRALRVYGDLTAAKPGDMFAFDQQPGQRVAVVVAAFSEPAAVVSR